MVTENKIDYSEVIQMIKEGLFYIMDNDEYGSYDSLQVFVSNEQFFVNKKEARELSPNTLYIVVKFAQATVDYGVTVLPLTIVAISEQNQCELCQKLLQDFTTMANMELNNTETIQQFYESPAVTSNFNEMFEGYRSVIQVSGTFVISPNANPFTLQWWNMGSNKEDKWEDVYFINGDVDGNFQPEPKLFYQSNNYTESLVTMGTVTFNISSILLKDEGFYDEMLKFITGKQKTYEIDLDPQSATYGKKVRYAIDTDQQSATYGQRVTRIAKQDAADVNKDIIFKLTFRNGQELIDIFKMANIHIQQVLKKIPMVTLVFTN